MNDSFHTEPYTGTVSGMKDSPWLASEDLLGLGSVEVEIAGVNKNTDVPMDGGRKEACLYSVAFKGKQKQMILNATNRKTLSRAFGADIDGWIGQTVKLFVQDGIRKPGGKRGETTTGLRIDAGNNNPLSKRA
jgi:hypothetical protein